MLQLRCLGGLSLARNGQALTGLAAQPRRLALLALLARAGEKGLRRERLISYLWPDADEERGRRSLAQALYAIRRELSDDEVITGTQDLRLNSERIQTDLAAFRRSADEGDNAAAVAAYAGPFLDGFWLTGFPELERWMEDERQALALEFSSLLEKLAVKARNDGDTPSAVIWWKRLAAIDSINGRIAVALMDALVASNDRAGALRHAEIFEALYKQEMDATPSGETAAFISRLRNPPASAAASRPADTVPVSVVSSLTTTPEAIQVPVSPSSEEQASPVESIEWAGKDRRATQPRAKWRMIGLATAATVVVAATGGFLWQRAHTSGDANPIVAVGRLSEFGGGSNAAGPIADLLATNLARVNGLRVISSARIQELSGTDTNASATVSAAREAGATELIEGTLYTQASGRLRLDLRRVDLASGRIREAQSVEGADLFVLVDSGTARLVKSFGAAAPSTSIADVTTSSIEAYQLYTAGLRQFFAGDIPAAERLFAAALREDPQFAMAAYYYARSSNSGWAVTTQRMEKAVQLSTHASDRERLLIRAGWAGTNSSPELAAIAESLVTRYPDDVQGYLTRGLAAAQSGDRVAEMAAIRRVIAMDSVGLIRGRTGCAGCEATTQLIQRYLEIDSVATAVEEARRWTRLQPRSIPAWRTLGNVYEIANRNDDATAAWKTAAAIDSTVNGTALIFAQHWIRIGAFTQADSILHDISNRAGRDAPDAREALWYLSLSSRQQGRLGDALDYAQQYRALTSKSLPSSAPGSTTPTALVVAQVEQELGHPRVAAALFDSIMRWRSDQPSPSNMARNNAWNGTHVADALAMAGDTTALGLLEDSIRVNGARSAYPRDRLLHHYVHGLRLVARGDDANAVTSFRAAIWSSTFGHTRTNLMLARSLMRLGRAREAVSVLQPALRGSIEASNLYVTRTELHEALAQAWDAAGNADSAASHYDVVAKSWSHADALLQPRRALAVKRVSELRKK